MQKWDKDSDPPWGEWGSGIERAYSRYLLLCSVTMHCWKIPLGSYKDEPKGLQNYQKVKTEGGDTPGELQMAQMSVFGQHLLLFLDGPAKNQQASINRKCPKTLWKCLWTTQKKLFLS